MKSSTMTRLFSTAAVVGALATPAIAQEEGITLPGASAEVTLDYVTNYFFRGIEQTAADDGVVIQPGASLTLPVAETDGLAVSATVGTWMSFHTGAENFNQGSNPRAFYEADIYGSIDFEMGPVSAGVGITYYTYPSTTANGDITELNLSVAYDDSELLGDFAFSPYAAVAIELQNNASAREVDYLELGGAFTIPTDGTVIEAWDWSVPFAFGLSLDEYYTDSTGDEELFGFFSVGLAGSIQLSELIGTDEYFGAWSLNVGVTFYLLNADLDSSGPGGAPSGLGTVQSDNRDDYSDNYALVGTVGISREW